MAIEKLVGGVYIPNVPVVISGSNPGFTSLGTMNASGRKSAYIVYAPKTGNLESFECRAAGTITNTNGLRFSFQNLNSSGNPDGTVDQFRNLSGNFVSGDWLSPGIISSDGTDGGALRSVVKGEKLACVVDWPNWVTGDTAAVSDFSPQVGQFPYNDFFISSWTKTAGGGALVLKYSDGEYRCPTNCYPAKSTFTTTFSNATNPREVGLAFSFRAPVLCGGAGLRIELDGDCNLNLYDSQMTLLRQTLMESKDRSTLNVHFHHALWPDIYLAANERYYLMIDAQTATSCNITGFIAPSSAYLLQMEGGESWFYVEKDSGTGAPTEFTDRRPWFEPIISGFDHEIGGQPSTGDEGDL